MEILDQMFRLKEAGQIKSTLLLKICYKWHRNPPAQLTIKQEEELDRLVTELAILERLSTIQELEQLLISE